MITLERTDSDFGRCLEWRITMVPRISWNRVRIELAMRLLKYAFRFCGVKVCK